MSPQSLRRCSQAWESVRYLRPTEALRMRCKDLVRPPARQRRYRRWTVVLRFLELQHSSKTQEFDETLELDLSYHENVGEALASVMKIDMRAPDFSYCSPTPSETSATLWCVVQRPFSFKPWELYTRIVYAVAVPHTISTRDSEIWRAYSFADGGKVNQASDAKGRAPGSAVRKPAKGGAKAGNRQYKQSPAPRCIPALVRALPDVLVHVLRSVCRLSPTRIYSCAKEPLASSVLGPQSVRPYGQKANQHRVIGWLRFRPPARTSSRHSV